MPNNPVFPILSVQPSDNWGEDMPDDPVLRTKFESGNISTRLRVTRSLNQKTIVYPAASGADKLLVQQFAATVGWGAIAFNWMNTLTEVSERVKFAKPPAYKLNRGEQNWDITIVIKDA